MQIGPVTLDGQTVRLEPLSFSHVPELTLVGTDEGIWRFMVYGKIEREADMRGWVKDMLARQSAGGDIPFAVVSKDCGKAIGATRYMNIRRSDRALEIGGTWYGVAYQRTGVNTECKYLLLRHAFETLGCIRVQLKTDARNLRSQRSIERIGAIREGVLRNHMILPDGTVRDSVYYSIVASEWSQVKVHLESLMAKY
jgi:RimJ/RimL family protein N-acetyltransferase